MRDEGDGVQLSLHPSSLIPHPCSHALTVGLLPLRLQQLVNGLDERDEVGGLALVDFDVGLGGPVPGGAGAFEREEEDGGGRVEGAQLLAEFEAVAVYVSVVEDVEVEA